MTEEHYVGANNFPTTLWGKCKKVLSERGISRTFKYGYELIYYMLKPRNRFIFNDKEYKCFYHWYNTTWRGEREIELAIFLDIINKEKGRILEFGNVLGHYTKANYDILDKYEIDSGVINEDVITFNPKEKYDLVVSVSTLEHVGWDEEPKNPEKIMDAIYNMKNFITPNGKIMFTVPLGFNSYLDRAVLENKLPLDKTYYYKKINGIWIEKEMSPDEKFEIHYDLLIGVINGNNN